MSKALRMVLIVAGCVISVRAHRFHRLGDDSSWTDQRSIGSDGIRCSCYREDNGNFVVFTPTATTPISGFILYPGGHVDYRSYAPIAREIASRGYRYRSWKCRFHWLSLASTRLMT